MLSDKLTGVAMPLQQDSEPTTTPSLDGEIVGAKDSSGKAVTVSASHEAITDYGWPTIWQAASAKHDAEGGDLVRVTTEDCAKV